MEAQTETNMYIINPVATKHICRTKKEWSVETMHTLGNSYSHVLIILKSPGLAIF